MEQEPTAKDQAATNEDVAEAPLKPTLRYEVVVADGMLQSLVARLQVGEGSFPITISLGGMVVAGHITNGEDFFRGCGECIKTYVHARTGSEEIDENIDEAFSAIAEKRKEFVNALPENDPSRIHPQHLHLKDVVIIGGGTRTDVPWWRCRFTSIDGFVFGLHV